MSVTLGDRYEVGAALGSGGMATVYSGRDRVLGRPVAIKMLADRYAGDDRFVTRFRREARAAARLNHHNIVSIFDTGDTNGQHYIVMELVDGETLADLLRREGRLSPDRAARIGSAVAVALQVAHDQGFVHRDVKPGNVMITPRGEVKVMDFGIAHAATDETLTQTGMVLGTASYLSPEQIGGDTVDHRSDVYSLGCVVYEMLSGHPPFSADTPVSLAYKHVNEAPEALTAANPTISRELEGVVMRTLEKDPGRRYSSADELGESLRAAVAGEPTEPMHEATAILPAPTEPIHAPPRRRRLWIPIGLIAAVLALGIVAAFVVGDRDRPEKAGGNRQERQQLETVPVEPTVTTPPPVANLAGAVSGIQEHVSTAVASGQLDEALGSEILDEVEKAMEEYAKGDLDKALEHIGHADEEIQVGFLKGTVSSMDLATALANDLGVIRVAMESGAPPIEVPDQDDSDESGSDGGSDSAPGNSENAPGHNKDKDD